MSFWTTERVDRLKILVADGLSSAKIAAQLGCSRNAVIGKVIRMNGAVGRLGISGPRLKQARPATAAKPRPAKAASTPAAGPVRVSAIAAPTAQTAAAPSPVAPEPRMLPLTALTEQTCRWPVGDPKTEAFGFCGHAAHGRSPYCAHHTAVSVSEHRLKPIRIPHDSRLIKAG